MTVAWQFAGRALPCDPPRMTVAWQFAGRTLPPQTNTYIETHTTHNTQIADTADTRRHTQSHADTQTDRHTHTRGLTNIQSKATRTAITV